MNLSDAHLDITWNDCIAEIAAALPATLTIQFNRSLSSSLINEDDYTISDPTGFLRKFRESLDVYAVEAFKANIACGEETYLASTDPEDWSLRCSNIVDRIVDSATEPLDADNCIKN